MRRGIAFTRRGNPGVGSLAEANTLRVDIVIVDIVLLRQ